MLIGLRFCQIANGLCMLVCDSLTRTEPNKGIETKYSCYLCIESECLLLFMRKQLVLGAIAAGIILVAVLVIAIFVSSPPKTVSEPLKAIPLDAGMIIKVNSLTSLRENLNNSPLWKELKKFESLAQIDSLFWQVDSVMQKEGGIVAILDKGEIFLSVHLVGKNEPHLLVTSKVGKGFKHTEIEAVIKKQLLGLFQIAERNYNGVVVTLFGRSGKTSIEIAHNKGVFMISTSPLLLERALKQQGNSTSLVTDRAFLEVQKTAGSKIDANIFIAHKNFPSLFSGIVSQNYSSSLSNLSDLATWTELDLIVKPNAHFLNGFTQAPDSTNAYLKWMSRQKPVNMSIPDILPSQTALFAFLGISNIDLYMQDYRGYLDRLGNLRNYKKNNESIAKLIGVEPVSFYSSFFKNELAVAYVPFSQTIHENWFTIVGTKGKSTAQTEIIGLVEALARKNGVPLQSLERTFKIDRDKQVKVYTFPVEQFHASLFGSLFQPCSDQFFTIIDSYVVFGASPEALSQFVLAQIRNTRLENSPHFRDFMQVLAQESNFTLYINPQLSQFALSHFVNPKYGTQLLKGFERATGVEGMALQLTGGKAMIFNNICIKYGDQVALPNQNITPQTVWETQLDTVIRGKPSLVLNHNSRNREIFVQDYNNSIYLINDAGRVLWKVRISEPIFGEVQQVDLYKNGKLQLLFGTRTEIHVIDRNGKYVEGFPIKLPSLATSPVAIFDYEKNRDYRFFVALDDRRIVAYERNGKPLSGWEFGRTERVISRTLQHFRVGGLDFILAADDNRIYLLDRRGKERIKPLRHFPPSRNGNIVLEEASNRTPPRFVTTDSLGVVRFIYLDGRVDDKVLTSFSSSHFFDYQDVDGDGQKDFIFLDRKQLKVINTDSKEIFSNSFASAPIPLVIYFNFGGRDRKLGVVNSALGQIFLINSDGSNYNNFPLVGYTPFSIGQFNSTKTKFNLIVGSKTGSVFNYAVQ